MYPAVIKRAFDRATDRPEPRKIDFRSRRVYLFGDVIPGGSTAEAGWNRLTLSRLRGELIKIAASTQIVSLADLFSSGGNEKQGALIFGGGYIGQLLYGLPLLEALELPGHLFVSCQRFGSPGRLNAADLKKVTQIKRIGLELDLAPALPPSSRKLALELANASKMMRRNAGVTPRYIRISEPSLSRHYRFLLSQFGIKGAVSAQAERHRPELDCPLLKTSRVSSRNWFKIPSF